MWTTDRSQRIEANLPLVHTLAARFVRRGEPFDDLVQVGVIGLIHAVDRFDPARGNSFEAYAIPTITGEIRRHLRDACAAVRLPRRASEERARLYGISVALEARDGRVPTVPEIAAAAGVTPAAVESALHPPRVEPLDDDLEYSWSSDPIAALVDGMALAAAVRKLPTRERRVVLLTFYGECSQRRVADQLGLSQVHVSRLLRSSLATLRTTLEEGPPVAGSVSQA
jgi:RNA polymerase sigma-B factor